MCFILASDLLSTVARLSQGLMPLVKTEKLGEDKIPPTNPFIPAAKGKQPPALLQSCTMTGSQTKVPQKSMTADNDRPSTISGYEGKQWNILESFCRSSLRVFVTTK